MSNDCHLNTGRGFLATTLAAIIAMVVLMSALLASGCSTAEAEEVKEEPTNVFSYTLHHGGKCYVAFVAHSHGYRESSLAMAVLPIKCTVEPL